MADLTGRRVLVTGGSRGIGAAIVCHLAAAGAAVAFTYRRAAAAATAMGERTGAAAIGLDLADPAAAPGAVEAAADRLGGLDAVVSNAGVASSGRSVADTPLDELARVLAVHAVGPHQLCRAALPHLRAAGRGDVVFVSSVVTSAPVAGGGPYVMAKAAAEGLAACLAREERRHGIRVNVVAPGLVDTEMGRRLVRATRDVHDIRELDADSPNGRVCAPEDVAAVVGFLLGPGAGYVNDQRITVDRGTF
ncbi:SDR family NAD(P)-dependent oxidoreductase [Actinophytocola sp.]|uniref:SDR family NAD(P)-dependent oxidoreductase n=1 Tax=Actinophytocola sp. TaxID=1872138 RepID=UPI003D6BA70A